MKIAMGALAVLATVGGFIQIPHVNEALHHFLEPAFHDSHFYEELAPSGTSVVIGMVIGAALGAAGIFIAYTLWVRSPERPKALQARFAPVHTFFVNKWYFDEAIDLLVARPMAWFGRFANSTFERAFVNGVLVGGTSGLVRLGSAAVRRVQTGYLRYYAALLLMGITTLSAYFLISA